jgi:hypothetical protein
MLLGGSSVPGDEAPRLAPPAPLPRYYRNLKLDREQTAKIRKTQARYQARIDELMRQVRALEKEQAAELEKHLTGAQRACLKELRALGSGEFKISAPRKLLKVHRGDSTTFAVELSHDKAFEGDVTLTFPDLPKGIKITPSPLVFKHGGDPIGELTLSTDRSMEIGEYRFTIQATPESGDRVQATVKVLVTL